jgi:hypothetical protein
MRSFATAMVLTIGISVFAAAPARAQAPAAPAAPAAAAAPAATANQRLFNGDAGITLIYVKPDKTADFEAAMTRVKEALMKSEKPERKQQGAGLKLFKAVASPQGQIYVLLANPSVKNADYSVAAILTDGLPAEARAIYDSYAASLSPPPAAQVVIPLDLVNDFSK